MASDKDWENYKARFKKIYQDAEEEQMRRDLYSKVRQRVDEHNKLYEANKFAYSKDVNKYSDYTPEELAKVDWNTCTSFKREPDTEEPEMPEIDETY